MREPGQLEIDRSGRKGIFGPARGDVLFIQMRTLIMKSQHILATIFLAAFTANAMAEDVPTTQVAANATPAITGNTSLYQSSSPFRLFDPTRLTFNHSYSLSYFSGGSVGSGSMGLYRGSVGYQISRPLFLQVDVGIVHQPGAMFSNNVNGSNAQILPNLSLRYTPSPKFNLIINVQTMPNQNYGYGRLGWRNGLR
jgi:hypothetical protein